MKRILVVDDDEHVRELVSLCLRKEGFTVSEAADGPAALEQARKDSFELVVLDLMLPGLDGWEVCRRLQKDRGIPVIMLTAKGEEVDRVAGLELGADDYVTKPFSPRELVARVRAVLRRIEGSNAAAEILEIDGLRIDMPKREVLVRGLRAELTPREYELLVCLARQPGRVYTRQQLLDTVWGYDFFGDARTVDEHVKRLRKKMDALDPETSYLATVWGVGYKVEVKSSSASSERS